MKTRDFRDLHRKASHSHELATLQVVPTRLSQPPLELVAIHTRALDSTQQPNSISVERSDELFDELSLLRQRVALLEQALEDARQLAYHDNVTGIPNRRLLEDRFEQAKARSDRQRKSLAVLFLDIDGFKQINDAHGHAVGDDLLRRIAARLIGCIRASDTVCRYGGDEFVILLPESDGLQGAMTRTRRIREQLSAPHFAGTASIALPASIGMALYPADGTGLGRLIEKADSAMYCEKTDKRGGQRNRPQVRVDLTGTGADSAAMRRERKKTHNKEEARYSLEEDAFTNEGAPPPAASTPHVDTASKD